MTHRRWRIKDIHHHSARRPGPEAPPAKLTAWKQKKRRLLAVRKIGNTVGDHCQPPFSGDTYYSLWWKLTALQLEEIYEKEEKDSWIDRDEQCMQHEAEMRRLGDRYIDSQTGEFIMKY